MIISRTPLRVSFTGGGSDLPAFYQKYGGAVISSAIDKYVYVNVNKKFDNGIRVSYSKTEEVQSVAEIEHRIVRASLGYLGIRGGIEITSIADVPSKGTGLGSSSSFTVGLLNALHAYLGQYVSSEQLGYQSCQIEIDHCNEPIGKQDQYAAAYGGFNLIEFKPDESVIVSPIICQRDTVAEIENNLLVFYTGITRSASSLLARQGEEISIEDEKQKTLLRMVDLTYDLRRELQKNNTHVFGEILHENWILKKSLLNEISTPEIDRWYESAIRAGAIGGKILGAGAGGFLLFYVPRKAHDTVRKALAELRQINFKFEPLGSRIIFYQ